MSSPNEAGDPLTGSHLFGFDVQERLGAGGMGVVYRAVDRQLGRSVALKVLTDAGAGPDSPERERFLREARAASALDHPNIGTIYSVQELPDGRMCIVMAYYDGKTLADRMKQGRMSLASALAVAIQVADGLAAARERGIIHRDIKPSNIMLGSGGIVKIVDFGLAKLMEGEDKLTKTSIVLGTVSYMSPEQARGRELDARTDIWSVGVVLYEMLSGRVPFPGSNTIARLYSVVHEQPEAVNSGLEELDACVRKALAKKSRDRYESMAEFAADLRRISASVSRSATEETQILRTAETVILPPLRSRRRRLGIGYLIAGGTLAILAAGWFYPPARNAVLDRFQTGAARGHAVLAILPFTSDQGPELSALAAGMSQAMSARLGGVERLRETITIVAPSELVSRTADDPAGTMKNLGATIAVAGRLRREAGGRLRLVLHVVDRDSKDPADYVIEDAGGDLRMVEDRAAAEVANLLDAYAAAGIKPGVRGRTESERKAYEAYLRGTGYLQRWDKPGNLEKAIEELGESARLNPHFAPAQIGLASASRLKYESDRDPADLQHALNYAQRASELDPRLAETHVVLGRLHRASGRRDLAVLEFQEALQMEPRSSSALIGLGLTYEDLGQMKEAEEAARKAAALSPFSWAAQNSLAGFYLGRGRYPEAETAYRRALELTPDNPGVSSNLAVVLQREGKLAEAIQMAQQSIEAAPTYPAYTNLANVYYAQREYAKAADAYNRALELKNDDYRIWGSRAQALRHAGAPKVETARAFRRALELAGRVLAKTPDDIEALRLTAVYRAALGERDQALAAVDQALTKANGDRDVFVSVAVAYSILGEREKAAEWARKAVEAGYTWPEINDAELDNARAQATRR